MRLIKQLLILGPLAVFVVLAQQPQKVDDSALRKASPDEWVTYGHDYAETHFSPLKQINADNVNRLGLAWTWETGTEGGIESTPLVSNGTLYATGPLERGLRRRWPHRPAQAGIADHIHRIDAKMRRPRGNIAHPHR
jgi:hypothetical protein